MSAGAAVFERIVSALLSVPVTVPRRYAGPRTVVLCTDEDERAEDGFRHEAPTTRARVAQRVSNI